MSVDLGAVDHAMRNWVVAHRSASIDRVMWVLSVVGRGGTLFLVAGAIMSVRRRSPRDFATVAAAILIGALVADHILKPAVHRVRPFVSDPRVAVIGTPPDDWSFPSGHAATCFAGAAVLTAAAPGGAWVWWSIAIAVAYSRVYLGVHYPGDVLGGALIGVGSAGAVVAATRARRQRARSPSRY